MPCVRRRKARIRLKPRKSLEIRLLPAPRTTVTGSRTALTAARTTVTSSRTAFTGTRIPLTVSRTGVTAVRMTVTGSRTTVTVARMAVTTSRTGATNPRKAVSASREAVTFARRVVTAAREGLPPRKMWRPVAGARSAATCRRFPERRHAVAITNLPGFCLRRLWRLENDKIIFYDILKRYLRIMFAARRRRV